MLAPNNKNFHIALLKNIVHKSYLNKSVMKKQKDEQLQIQHL